jgi:hypothetical protein
MESPTWMSWACCARACQALHVSARKLLLHRLQMHRLQMHRSIVARKFSIREMCSLAFTRAQPIACCLSFTTRVAPRGQAGLSDMVTGGSRAFQLELTFPLSCNKYPIQWWADGRRIDMPNLLVSRPRSRQTLCHRAVGAIQVQKRRPAPSPGRKWCNTAPASSGEGRRAGL